MKIDLDKIERDARAAQERSPGPWRRVCNQWRCDKESCNHCDYIRDSTPKPDGFDDYDGGIWLGSTVLETDSGYYEPKGVTAEHIANCSPDVVLALVARIRELEGRYEGEHADDCMIEIGKRGGYWNCDCEP